MGNKERFIKLCAVMAELDATISLLESIGLNPEPEDGIGFRLYNGCSQIYHVASSYLDIPSVEEENEVFDKLMQMTEESMEPIAREVWDKYGIK